MTDSSAIGLAPMCGPNCSCDTCSRYRREQSEKLIEVFLASGIRVLAFEPEDARHAGDIRAFLETRGTPIGPHDVLIAAQARRHGAELVSENRREFDRVPGLIVTDWMA